MPENELKKILERAVKNLFMGQPNIYKFTPETGQSEWNLAHHLANEIHRFFPRYDCDLDIIKCNFEDKRPDIIFHKRGGHKSNFLVIEIKRDKGSVEIADDIRKIKSYWFKYPLNYKFGAVVNLKKDKTSEMQVFKDTSIETPLF